MQASFEFDEVAVLGGFLRIPKDSSSISWHIAINWVFLMESSCSKFGHSSETDFFFLKKLQKMDSYGGDGFSLHFYFFWEILNKNVMCGGHRKKRGLCFPFSFEGWLEVCRTPWTLVMNLNMACHSEAQLPQRSKRPKILHCQREILAQFCQFPFTIKSCINQKILSVSIEILSRH